MSFLADREAFTLIELLVVVAIIGILAAAAIPQVMSAICKSQVGAAQSTMSTLRTAMGQCRAENAGSGSCSVTDINGDANLGNYLPASVGKNWSVSGSAGDYNLTFKPDDASSYNCADFNGISVPDGSVVYNTNDGNWYIDGR